MHLKLQTRPHDTALLYRAFRFELKHLRAWQAERLHRSAGAARFCYNALLALCAEDYAEYLEELESRQSWGEVHSRAEARALTQAPLSQRGQFALNYELKALKQTYPFLKDCHSQVLQQKLADLHQSFENFFAGRSGRPQFKKKGGSDSIRYPQGFKLEEGNSRLYLPKIGWVSYRNSRRIAGTPKSVTVSHRAGKWYVSVLCEQPAPQPLTAIHSERGIVVTPGTDCLFRTSEGERLNLPEGAILKLEHRLHTLQLRLRHKQPHSRRTERLRERLTRVQKKISDLRLNSLHQISTRLLKNHELVLICPGSWIADTRTEQGLLRTPVPLRGQGTCPQHDSAPDFAGALSLLCRLFDYKAQSKGGALITLRSQDLKTFNQSEGSDLPRAGLARLAHERGIEISGQNFLEVNSQGSQQCEPLAQKSAAGLSLSRKLQVIPEAEVKSSSQLANMSHREHDRFRQNFSGEL